MEQHVVEGSARSSTNDGVNTPTIPSPNIDNMQLDETINTAKRPRYLYETSNKLKPI